MKTFRNRLSTLQNKQNLLLCIILFALVLNIPFAMAQMFSSGKIVNRDAAAIRATIKQIYTSQIGVRESKPNAGTAVGQYLKYVGLPTGNPWCAAFVCWVYGEAGVENPRSGWSPDLFPGKRVIWPSMASPVSRIKYQESRFGATKPDGAVIADVDGITVASCSAYPPRPITDYRLLNTHSLPIKKNLQNPPTPTAGDVFGLFFTEKGRIAHVGFIDQWDGTWMISVEGNTNEAGSREGDGVYRKRRLVRSVYKVARYINP